MIIPADKRPVALAALYNAARAQGMGFLHYDPKPMTVQEAAELLKRQTYFDYVKGRVIKVDLSQEYVEFRMYDRDNGQGRGEQVVMEALTDPRS